MTAPAGGYLEAVPGPVTRRRQNPHMHLLEALLAWHEIVPNEGFDARAWAIVDLLQQRFLVHREEVVALVEYFDETLNPLGGPDYAFEPGHHFEWVWLLGECARLTGRDSPATAEALWASAMKFGFRADGAIFDEIAITGLPLKNGARLWPLTEALKACCSRFSIPAGIRARNSDELAATLLTTFLHPATSGLWCDHFDATGKLATANAPASSLYHLCCAISQF